VVGSLRRRLQAFIALVVFTGGLALPFAAAGHLAFDDDAACGGTVFAAGGAGPEFAPPEPVRVGGHCAICHWLRTAGGARAALAAAGDTWFQPAEIVDASSSQRVAGAEVSNRSSRAPPVRF
jgi:mono/diheme cytochrome c family protein